MEAIAGATQVAIINETIARRYFADEDPIGKTIWMGPPESLLPPEGQTPENRFERRTIVGVVADVLSIREQVLRKGSRLQLAAQVFVADLQVQTVSLVFEDGPLHQDLPGSLRDVRHQKFREPLLLQLSCCKLVHFCHNFTLMILWNVIFGRISFKTN